MRNFRNLEIWQRSISLAKKVYSLTRDFPKHEQFGLASQMQRASVSIASNIAEGSSRTSNHDFARFLEIAVGSAFEAETQLTIANELGYLDPVLYTEVLSDLTIIQKQLSTLITKVRSQLLAFGCGLLAVGQSPIANRQKPKANSQKPIAQSLPIAIGSQPPIPPLEKAEIVIYKESTQSDFQIEVRVEDDTVWLNRQQMAELFDRDIKTIGKHINNALGEELKSIPVIAKFATTASDGKTYQVEHYNLDLILSVGYRVKSQRGVQFRRWANDILKEHLLRGHLLNYRFEKIEKKLLEHDQKFDLIINTGLKPAQGIFFDGQVFDAWQFVSQLIKSARHSIILIDNYIDESVLMLLSKRNPVVKATIFTGNLNKLLEADLKKHNQQYPPIELKHFSKSHDRFLIIDHNDVYHIGASLKDLGKKWFAFSKMVLDASEIMNKLDATPAVSHQLFPPDSYLGDQEAQSLPKTEICNQKQVLLPFKILIYGSLLSAIKRSCSIGKWLKFMVLKPKESTRL